MKNIVIKWAVFLTAFLISLEVSAQNVRVSGVVTDQSPELYYGGGDY